MRSICRINLNDSLHDTAGGTVSKHCRQTRATRNKVFVRHKCCNKVKGEHTTTCEHNAPDRDRWGTQFACFTSTKVRRLTPEEISRGNRRHSVSRACPLGTRAHRQPSPLSRTLSTLTLPSSPVLLLPHPTNTQTRTKVLLIDADADFEQKFPSFTSPSLGVRRGWALRQQVYS